MIVECRACRGHDIEQVWRLEDSPYGDLFRPSKEEAIKLSKMTLTLAICQSCSLLQLLEEVDATQIYTDYLYLTEVTVGLSLFYSRLAQSLVRTLGLDVGELIVDVGSNDGSGLVPFKDAGMAVVGIEPALGPSQVAEARGIPTARGFLDATSRDQVVSNYGLARLICANAVMANVEDPRSFLEVMGSMLAPRGIISVVTGYHPDEFAVTMFDYINHDHLSYFTVKSMVGLADSVGLKLLSASRIEHKGGSIHFLMSRKEDISREPDDSIAKLLQREEWLAANTADPISSLAKRVTNVMEQTTNLLNVLGNVNIPGIGASISTTHLLHQFKLGNRVSSLFDDDPRKIGLYAPGFGIGVRPLPEVKEASGGAVLLLSWQHSAVLIARLRQVGFYGQVIVPLPNPKIISIAAGADKTKRKGLVWGLQS